MKRSIHLFFIILLTCCEVAHAQQVTIDNNVSVQDIIENHLVEGCVQVSNITSTVNGSVNGLSSFGYFERSTSNFPFEHGIVLTTGNASSGGNVVNTADLNEGTTAWGTDPDFETAVGITGTYNATSIEFDFISVTNFIQFEYLIASEEYGSQYLCDYADGFVFLIRESASTGPYTNIALIPGTGIPVSTNTIHSEIFGFCPAENETYFDNYDIGDTNYNGRTEVLTASASIQPNVQYHVKLIIAEEFDQNFDSAVFIQGNSLTPDIDLGEDMTTCADTLTLNGDIGNILATYDWYLDDNPIIINGSPLLNINQSGTYRIVASIPLGAETCIIEDEIVINLSSEQTPGPISDYQLCDIDDNGIETFDLSTKDAEVLASVPPATYVLSYHYTLPDAENNANAITSPINSSGDPQVIYARIEDLDGGCLAYAPINLVVNPLPNISDPGTYDICDDAIDDGYTSIELSQIDTSITSGQSNLVVSYHLTAADANDGINGIVSPYTNVSTPTELLHVRVTDNQSGCFIQTTVTIQIINNPIINQDPIYIDACDMDHDGFATFDLTSAVPEILQGLTGVSATFYETQADAESGTNSITNDTNYPNVDQYEQIIYSRVEDNITGCASIRPIEIHTNMLLTATNIQDFALCDDEGDGEVNFDLGSIAIVIANEIPGIDITFYETQADRDSGTNPLDPLTPFPLSTSPTPLFFEITNGSCTEVAEIELLINAFVSFAPIGSQDYCDTDDDGFGLIDLSSFDALVTSGNSDYNVLYYPTELDALHGTNAHPTPYVNISNPEIIYTRIQNNITGCFDVNSFEINIIPAPTVTQPQDIIICDNDQDAFSIIDLNEKIAEIVPSQAGLIISFYTSDDDANNNTNEITGTTAYNATTQPIYVRVESEVTGCYALVSFEVLVNTLPVISQIDRFQLCEDDGDSTAEFLFETMDNQILNGQTGKEVFYFESLADAINRTAILDKTMPYENTSSPQTIYVRVENVADQDCFETSSFTIEVAPNPTFNIPSDFVLCDDPSNDGTDVFDLNAVIDEMTSGITPVPNISFHESLADAENNNNPLPLTYSNITNPQQVYVRVESEGFCSVTTEFGILLLPMPEISMAEPLEFCDPDNNGIHQVDLTASQFEIFDVRQDNIEASYYESFEDLELQINEIPSPEAYTNLSNPQTVYLRVTNTSTQCYVSVPIEVVINDTPVITEYPMHTICDNVDNLFTLSSINTEFISDIQNYNVTYYSSQMDAELGTNPLADDYNYRTNSDIIHVRVEFNDSGCFTLTSFILNVNLLPAANIPPDLENCDDDFDGIAIFDLTVQDAFVLGAQDPSNLSISYHGTFSDAENGTGELGDFHESENGEVIFVRIENLSTGCVNVTDFITIVHPRPTIDIEDLVYYCNDEPSLTISANTNEFTDTYLWSNGETTPEIVIDVTQIGDYWVTVTTQYGCETTHEFSVTTSEPANIEFTTTVDFSNPNSITVDVNGEGNYVFLLDNGEPQQSNFFNDVAPGLHVVTVRDLNGCTDVNEEVFVIDVPLFVTPNGDGYFDTWHIIGIEQLPGTIVYIFDRYGKLLKTLSHTSVGWNGTYNGAMMPASDYWFLADVKKDGAQFEYRGHFTLRR
jgi:gliding motility-associated-like protein